MLSITKKAGYGMVAMTHLATLSDDRVSSAREIAELFGVPVSLLMNVLKELSSAGLVASTRGAKGGYRLARPAAEVTMADILTALEGPIRLADCVEGNDDKACKLVDGCPIVDPVHRVNRRISDILTQVTLEEMADPAGAPSGE
ncbi:MAG: RrF2 family transcriptional regulator [Phycisphaerae bacterium]